MSRRRGILVPCIILLSLLLVLCLANLSRQPYHYRAARASSQSSQARALARTGLEDFLTKWRLDLYYPPPTDGQSQLFTYSQPVLDAGGQPLGSFRIEVDGRWSKPPHQVLRVFSDGLLGDGQQPQARYRIEAILDLCPDPRPGRPASHLGEWIEWHELSFP